LGAGVRVSRGQARAHGLIGDAGWQDVGHAFTVTGEAEEVALLCELRAEKGEAWFDVASLKLHRTEP
jgi:hypothetical protein